MSSELSIRTAGRHGSRVRRHRFVRNGSDRLRRILLLLACLGIGSSMCVIGIFWFQGGRLMTVTSPSMGEAAPVGTLLLTKPLGERMPEVGDIVVFRPPAEPSRQYAHRVIGIDGRTWRTQGDLNGAPDPWELSASDISGLVTGRLVGVGWLLQMVPILGFGSAAIAVLLRYYIRPGYRWAGAAVGGAVVLSAAVWVVRPLVGASLISQTVVDGTATSVVVPTGLLTLRVEAFGGTAVSLRPGELGAVVSDQVTAQGSFVATIGPDLTFWTWILFGVLWSLPLLICTFSAFTPLPAATHKLNPAN